ncbi:hypothetical protein ACT7C3_29305 [Bacillus pacificus]
MKGHFHQRNYTYKKKRRTCGAIWSFVSDIKRDPAIVKRKQEIGPAATEPIDELNQGLYVGENTLSSKISPSTTDNQNIYLHITKEIQKRGSS